MRPGKNNPRPDSFASDATFSDPGHTWDTQPNKVALSGAQFAQGWFPERRRVAMNENALQNNVGVWIAAHDAIEVQNWTTPGIHSKVSILHAEKQCCALGLSSQGDPRFYLASGTSIAGSLNGSNWINEVTGIAAAVTTLAADTTTQSVLACDDGDTVLHIKTQALGGWGTLAIATQDHYYDSLYSPAWTSFYACSISGANTSPNVVKVNELLTTVTVTALTVPSGFTTPSQNLAPHFVAGGTIVQPTLALCASQAGQNPAVWVSTDGATFALHRITLTTNAILEFFWDESQGFFYAIDTAGGIFSSSDGVNWVALAYNMAGLVDTAKTKTLSVYGSIWVMVQISNRMAYSTNQGTSWSPILHPFPGDANELKQYPVQRTVALDGRFAALAEGLNNTDPHWISYSTRAL